jgi:hypothetical protein
MFAVHFVFFYAVLKKMQRNGTLPLLYMRQNSIALTAATHVAIQHYITEAGS